MPSRVLCRPFTGISRLMSISLSIRDQRGNPWEHCALTPEQKQSDFTRPPQQPWQRFWLIGIVNTITAITAVLNMQNNCHSFEAEAAGVAHVSGLCMEAARPSHLCFAMSLAQAGALTAMVHSHPAVQGKESLQEAGRAPLLSPCIYCSWLNLLCSPASLC